MQGAFRIDVLDKEIADARRRINQLQKKRKRMKTEHVEIQTNSESIIYVISSDDDDDDLHREDNDKRNQLKKRRVDEHRDERVDKDQDDHVDEDQVECLDDDHVECEDVDKDQLPVIERPLKGYGAERLLQIIVGRQVPVSKICHQVPRGIRQHASYVVDTKYIGNGSNDILCFGDDNGSWSGHSKPRRKYLVEEEDEFLVRPFNENEMDDIGDNVYTLYRNYFNHSHTPQFRKVIATVQDSKGEVLPLVVIQYFFEGGVEVPVKLGKHGNSKREDAEPYLRTSRPVLQKLKEKCKTIPCKKAVDECFEESGGSLGCKSAADVPRNRQQAYNASKSTGSQSSRRHDFYDVLELLNQGVFVRDFGFAKSPSSQRTQPRSFQATAFQLEQLSRVCLSEKFRTVLSVDATFNCGPFYVTLTSFANKMFVNKTGKFPVMIGPSILHTTKEFEDYYYLTKQLKTHCKGFESLQAFGSDGEVNIANAFACELPDAVHLRCKVHLADNIERKLIELSFSKEARLHILKSVFGQRNGQAREKGLADASSVEDFDHMLDARREEWNNIEAAQHNSQPKFFHWFEIHLVSVMKENVIAPVREIAGLGSPAEFYTQNIAESTNRMIKADAGGKKGWAEFCTSLQKTVELQEREMKKAVHQMGDLRLSSDFKHHEISSEKWLKMTNAQREAHLKKCFSDPLDKLGKSDDEGEKVSEMEPATLSVPHEECGITTMSKGNLKQIWDLAARILAQPQGVFPVPWDATGAQRMVFDGQGKTPCCVTVSDKGVKCACPKYKSSMICHHAVAVAEHEKCLPRYISTIKKKKKIPDPYNLISEQLSKTSGQKPGAKRKGKANTTRPPLMEITENPSKSMANSTCTATSPVNTAAAALLSLSGNASQVNSNPFYLKELSGTTVRMCYGCKNSIRVPPYVPDPPHDLCIAHREYRAFRAPDGTVKVTNERQTCHYHLRMSCVKKIHQDFSREKLSIPQVLRQKLDDVHWALLEHEFEFL